MATVRKRILSESASGAGIIISAPASGTANLIHTAPVSVTNGTYDEVWIWAQNNHTADVELTVAFGGMDIKDYVTTTIAYKSGLVPIIPGFCLQNELDVKAFAAMENVITLHGFVNTITD